MNTVAMILEVARVLGTILTELAQLKAAMPQQEAVSRGTDPLEVAKGQLDQLVAHAEKASPS